MSTHQAFRQTLSDTAFIPLMGITALLLLSFFNLNQSIFLPLNSVSQYTGQWLWSALTLLGDPVVLLCIALSLHVLQTPKYAIAQISYSILPTLVIGGITVFYFKWLFAVTRPPGVLHDIVIIGQPPISGAFPSGHTTGVFAFATLVILHLSNTQHKLLMKIGIVLLALAVGESRIAVGAHWPLDVSAGIVLGWLCAITGFHMSKNWRLSTQRTTTIYMFLLVNAIFLLFKNTGAALAYNVQLIIALASLSIAFFSLYSLYKTNKNE